MKSKMFFSYYQRQLKGLSGLEVAQFFEERCRSEVAAEAARYEAAYKAAEEWVVSAHQSYVKDLVKQLEELEVSYRETARSCSFFAFGACFTGSFFSAKMSFTLNSSSISHTFTFAGVFLRPKNFFSGF